jgi:LacI family transcriptional regulator
MATSTQDDPEVRSARINAYRDRRIDALIVADARRDPADYQRLIEWGIPFVLVNRRNGRSPAVTTDDFLGGYLAGRHLVELGHADVAIFAGPASTSTGWERAAGCRKAFAEAGIDVPRRRVLRTTLNAPGGAEAMRRLLKSPREFPTAIFAADDHVAIGAMGTAQQAGLVAGRDFALVGFNDISVAGSLPVPLTTLRSQLSEMGRKAVSSIVGILNGESPLDVRLPLDLVVRATSTGPRTSA